MDDSGGPRLSLVSGKAAQSLSRARAGPYRGQGWVVIKPLEAPVLHEHWPPLAGPRNGTIDN